MKNDLLQELHNQRKFITTQNVEILNAILDLAIKHVKLLNSTAITECIYEVPVFLLGFPLYNIHDMSVAVNKKLKKLGLKTLYMEPNKIYISWKKI